MDLEILVGVGVLTLLVVLFMGPGMWSSSTGYPLVSRPWRWLKSKLNRPPPKDRS